MDLDGLVIRVRKLEQNLKDEVNKVIENLANEFNGQASAKLQEAFAGIEQRLTNIVSDLKTGMSKEIEALRGDLTIALAQFDERISKLRADFDAAQQSAPQPAPVPVEPPSTAGTAGTAETASSTEASGEQAAPGNGAQP